MQHLDEGTIHAWLDGALSAEEARQAELHVGACESCSAAVAEARGLIAASSMILSKLDTFPASIDAGFGGAVPPNHDIAAARTVSEARQRPARRSWFAGPGFRAAAAVLVLAGGAAVIQSVTGRDELARVVTDQALESKLAGVDSVAAEAMVAQDATAASAERAAPLPPPPVVTAAPVHPRPQAVVGGGAAGRQAEATAPARTADGMVTATGGEAVANREPAPAAPLAAQAAGAGALEQSGTRRLEERLRRIEPPQERDFASAAKSASAPAPEAVTRNAPDSLLAADTTRALSSAQFRREEGAESARGLAPAPASAPAGVAGRIASSAISALTDRADATSARCYVLTLEPWTPEKASIPPAPATRIILSPDTGTVGPSKGQRLVRPVPGSFEGSYLHAWWTEVSPSTLVLTWATGSEGVIMRLVRSGDTVAGTARTFGTAGGTEQSSSVQGSRVDCGPAR